MGYFVFISYIMLYSRYAESDADKDPDPKVQKEKQNKFDFGEFIIFYSYAKAK